MPVLPFTAEVMDSLLGRYNASIWPLPLLAVALAGAAFAHALRPVRGGDRLVAALLAAAWAWVGIAFHIRTVAAIDFMAPVYGAFFLAQGVLLAWSGVVRGRLVLRFRPDPAGWTGLGLTALAVAGYPLLATVAGQVWPSLPFAGTAPDPTAMLTLGLLLLTDRPVQRHLLGVPVMWSLAAGLQALSLGTPERLVLPVAAVLVVVLAVQSRRGATP